MTKSAGPITAPAVSSFVLRMAAESEMKDARIADLEKRLAEAEKRAPDQMRGMSIAEAAKRIGVNETTIWRMSKRGAIKVTRVAGRALVTEAEIARILQAEGP